MPIPTRAELKAYFETGDHPTQAQFAALIDAIYDLAQQNSDDAAAAVASADAAVATVAAKTPKAVAKVRYHSAQWVVDLQVGCTVALSGTQKRTMVLTFTTAMPDTIYLVEVESGTSAHEGGLKGAITAQTTASISVTLDISSNGANEGDLYQLIIWR